MARQPPRVVVSETESSRSKDANRTGRMCSLVFQQYTTNAAGRMRRYGSDGRACCEGRLNNGIKAKWWAGVCRMWTVCLGMGQMLKAGRVAGAQSVYCAVRQEAPRGKGRDCVPFDVGCRSRMGDKPRGILRPTNVWRQGKLQV
ncbi:hypothetical protein WMY93_003990 [Mugilogobius chulae]|uniref:Uncharacterized protein n=1 Tax=Mugilogobius chulae TaxID=88201 RepID=A0AAW0PVU0_9GOBI